MRNFDDDVSMLGFQLRVHARDVDITVFFNNHVGQIMAAIVMDKLAGLYGLERASTVELGYSSASCGIKKWITTLDVMEDSIEAM